jgi:hypothetical protein
MHVAAKSVKSAHIFAGSTRGLCHCAGGWRMLRKPLLLCYMALLVVVA